MLAHYSYPKNAPESKAMRSAFACAGLMICLIACLVSLDVAIRNDSAASVTRQAPDIKSAFVQPKLLGSIFDRTTDAHMEEVHYAQASRPRGAE